MFPVRFLLCFITIGVHFVKVQTATTTIQLNPSPTTMLASSTPQLKPIPTTILASSSTPTTPGLQLPDSIKYSCVNAINNSAVSNQILIDRAVLQNVSDIYAYKDNNIWHECFRNNSEDTFIILGCWNYDVIVAPRYGKDNDIIIGGKGSKLYQLKCSGPDTDHHSVAVFISESIRYAGSENVYGMDTVNAYEFDMRIFDHHNHVKDTYLVGDIMTLQITPKGGKFPDTIQWRVLTCTAYSAPVEIEFVNNGTVLSDTRIADEQINTETSYQIKLYAFHSVHNHEVIYACTIDTCLKKESSECMGNNKGRGRRSTDYLAENTAKAMIRVYDRTQDLPANDAFQSLLSMTMICVVSLLMWVYN